MLEGNNSTEWYLIHKLQIFLWETIKFYLYIKIWSHIYCFEYTSKNKYLPYPKGNLIQCRIIYTTVDSVIDDSPFGPKQSKRWKNAITNYDAHCYVLIFNFCFSHSWNWVFSIFMSWCKLIIKLGNACQLTKNELLLKTKYLFNGFYLTIPCWNLK